MTLPLFGYLIAVPAALVVAAATVLIAVLGFAGAPFWCWSLVGVAALYGFAAPLWLWVGFVVLAGIFLLRPARRVLSGGVLRAVKAMELLPAISRTEREAIDAGTVWVEAELFSGKPDFRRLAEQSYAGITAEEQAFLDGPVERACEMTDDWKVFQDRDLSPETWSFLKRERFFGMMIPEEYGGLGFSPSANSAVVAKLSTASPVLAITVMVPNSLGPAELLTHYGTPSQKRHYLPRLARGDEVPAFALTEPEAGSDAGSIQSSGTVFTGPDGRLFLRLEWNKRYITLAAVSTLLGLAIRLRDPDNLLGRGEDLGITCALVPTDAAGVVLGRRHDPLGVPFYNCPTEGHGVEVPLEDAVIGGLDGVGRGWAMLMESLAAGRGISLPALAAGGTRFVARVAGAHALIRKQFGLSIGRFEGVEEPLARIGGNAYLLEAARRYTCGGLDTGAKPAVVTAMVKHYFTEINRRVVNDGMDILAGNAISRGPRNVLANGYFGVPIAITVEGANILTRTLVIFGQGAIRCHPYVFDEVRALEEGDVVAFDAALWGHVGHLVRNFFRALLLSLTRGRLASVPVNGAAAPYTRKLAWSSASFAFLADLSMSVLGGDLKRKEKLAGRFADIFSWMYLGTAVLRRYEAEGRRREDLPLFHWSMRTVFAEIQEAFDGLYANLRLPGLTWLLRGPVASWSRLNRIGSRPSDEVGGKVAQALQTPGAQRDRVASGVFLPTDRNRAVGRLESAFVLCYQAEAVARKLRPALRSGELEKGSPATVAQAAFEAGLLTQDEAIQLQTAEEARADAIQVDSFTLEEYSQGIAGVGPRSPQLTSSER